MGPTLLGGAVGAAIGIAVQVALEVFGRIQAPWVAVIIGLLTGLGVRRATMAKQPGASYSRGALSAIIGLAAIVVSPQVVTKVLQARGTTAVTALNEAADAEPASKDEKSGDAEQGVADDGTGGERGEGKLPGNPGSPRSGYMAQAQRAKQNSDVWQFVYMAVGAFLAYELGRGSEKKSMGDERPTEPAVMTDPSQ